MIFSLNEVKEKYVDKPIIVRSMELKHLEEEKIEKKVCNIYKASDTYIGTCSITTSYMGVAIRKKMDL